MTKQPSTGKTTPTSIDAADAPSNPPVQAPPQAWSLKTAKANKVGKYAEGGINYQMTADMDRTTLFISITSNEGGGYFSRERVPFPKIEECVSKCDACQFPA